MERYIIEGPDLPKVIQENRVRVSRGTIKFTPVDAVPASEGFGGFDTKDAPEADTKEPAPAAKKTTRSK